MSNGYEGSIKGLEYNKTLYQKQIDRFTKKVKSINILVDGLKSGKDYMSIPEHEFVGVVDKGGLKYDHIKSLYDSVIAEGGDGTGIIINRYITYDDVIEIIKEIDKSGVEAEKIEGAGRFIGDGLEGIFIMTREEFEEDCGRALMHADAGLIVI